MRSLTIAMSGTFMCAAIVLYVGSPVHATHKLCVPSSVTTYCTIVPPGALMGCAPRNIVIGTQGPTSWDCKCVANNGVETGQDCLKDFSH
jgi:hypothetical protein